MGFRSVKYLEGSAWHFIFKQLKLDTNLSGSFKLGGQNQRQLLNLMSLKLVLFY